MRGEGVLIICHARPRLYSGHTTTYGRPAVRDMRIIEHSPPLAWTRGDDDDNRGRRSKKQKIKKITRVALVNAKKTAKGRRIFLIRGINRGAVKKRLGATKKTVKNACYGSEVRNGRAYIYYIVYHI